MHRKKLSIVFAVILILSLVGFLPSNGVLDTVSAENISVPGDYNSIQLAVDNAAAGDTIIVSEGNYIENIEISKPLEIKSEGEYENCIIEASDKNKPVLLISTNDVKIDGFTIKNSSTDAGISIINSDRCTISNNRIENNNIGISLVGKVSDSVNGTVVENNIIEENQENGIYSYICRDNRFSNNSIKSNGEDSLEGAGIKSQELIYSEVYNNTIENNQNGIFLINSDNNIIKDNKLVLNDRYGLELKFCSYNRLRENHFSQNRYNFDIFQHKTSNEYKHYIHDIDSTNTINNKPIYYFVDEKDKTIENNAGFIGLINCSNIVVRNLELSKNGQGILLVSSKNSLVENVEMHNNLHGIYLNDSDENEFDGNHIFKNNRSGITLVNAEKNKFSTNNISFNKDLGGIEVYQSTNNSFERNIVYKNHVSGINIVGSSKTKVMNNQFEKNVGHGIYINHYSYKNTINYNIVSNNQFSEISIQSNSENNTVVENKIRESKSEDTGYGIQIYTSSHNNLKNNNLNLQSSDGIYIFKSNNNSVFGNRVETDEGAMGIYLSSSQNNQITENSLMENEVGLMINASKNNDFLNNTIINSNLHGIHLSKSSNYNLVKGNSIFYTKNGYGLMIEGSYSNLIYDNYLYNSRNAYDEGQNSWNISKTPKENIAGGNYQGGNLWSDFDEEDEGARDQNGDGIADGVYDVPGESNIDKLPLINKLIEENLPPNIPKEPVPENDGENVKVDTTLQWTCKDPNPIDALSYDVYFGTTESPPKIISNQTSLSFSPGDLNYNTTYYWKIVAWDSFGESSPGPIWKFKTIPKTDNIPPSKVTSLEVRNEYDGKLSLSWDAASDNIQVDHYNIYRDNKLISTTTSTNFLDTGLQNGLSYSYQVSAVDIFENEGAKSEVVTGIPTVSSDENLPPTSPIINGPKKGKQSTHYNYSFLSADPNGDNIIYIINWGTDENTTSNYTANYEFFNMSHSWEDAGIYVITAYARDKNNSESESSSITVLIDAVYVGDIGYMLDKNSDGNYDKFKSNKSGIETNLKKENGNYLIDSDGDYSWDYEYDPENDSLREYEGTLRIGGLNLFCFVTLIAVAIAVITAIVFAFQRLREETPESLDEEELLEEDIEESEGWRRMKKETESWGERNKEKDEK